MWIYVWWNKQVGAQRQCLVVWYRMIGIEVVKLPKYTPSWYKCTSYKHIVAEAIVHRSTEKNNFTDDMLLTRISACPGELLVNPTFSGSILMKSTLLVQPTHYALAGGSTWARNFTTLCSHFRFSCPSSNWSEDGQKQAKDYDVTKWPRYTPAGQGRESFNACGDRRHISSRLYGHWSPETI